MYRFKLRDVESYRERLGLKPKCRSINIINADEEKQSKTVTL